MKKEREMVLRRTLIATAIVSLSASAFADDGLSNPTLDQFKTGFENQNFSSSFYLVSQAQEIKKGAVYANNTRISSDDSVFGTIFYAAQSSTPEFTLVFDEATFSGNRAINTLEKGGMVAGGAAFLKGTSSEGSNTFINSVFSNNVAEATNETMMAAGGALYLDAAKNAEVGTKGATATIQTTQDTTYSGNRVVSTDSGKWYELYGSVGQSGGGFAYLDRLARLVFDVQSGQLTIGDANAADASIDSIQSSIVKNESDTSSIDKVGDGTLVINSDFSHFYGKLNVDAGVMTLARNVEVRNTWTVEGGMLNLADVEIGQVQNGAFGTFDRADNTGTVDFSEVDGSAGRLVVNGGAVNANNITISGAGVDFMNGSELQETQGYGIDVAQGSLTLNNLSVQKGSVSLRGGLLQVNGDLTIGESANLDMSGGTLVTKGENIFSSAEDGTTWSKVNGFTANGGTIEITNKFDSYTLEDLKSAETLLGKDVAISFVNSHLAADDAEDLTFDDAAGQVIGNATIKVNSDSNTISANTTVAGIDLSEIESETFKVTSSDDKTLTLTGRETAGGNLFTGLNDATTTVSIDNLSLGTKDSDAGVVNVETLKVGKLLVNGTFDAKNVVLTSSQKNSSISENAIFTADSISGEGSINVQGVLALNTMDVDVTIASGGLVAVGAIQPAVAAQTSHESSGIALQSVETPVNGQVNGFIDASAADALVTVGGGSEDAFKTALANAGVEYDEQTNSGIYFADTLKLDAQGRVKISHVGTQPSNQEIAVGENGIIVISGQRFMNSDDYVIDGAARFASAARVVIDGLNSTGSINLATQWNSAGTNVAFEDGNAFFNEAIENAQNGPAVINVTTNEAAFGGDAEAYKLVDAMLASTSDEGIRNVLVAIGRENGGFIEGGLLTDNGFQALDETFALPVAAGTYNVAYDAAEQVTGTVLHRNLEPSTRLGVWADVFYTSNEAKSIYGDQGYSADIYGGTIGFDGTFSCGAKLGLAFSVGTGDADSEKSVGKYSNDADFYGVTVYTGKDIAGLYFSADASYLWLDNDISGQVAGASLGETIDSNVFTIGMRADMTVYDQAFKVVPHVGVRYTSIDVDDYRGLESDSMNIFEMPVGVKVAGDFETVAGWKLTPNFDFTIVPQVGDKDVSTIIGDVDVLDNLYNSTLGVNATYGDFAFSLSYRYGFGNDDRSNNAFQASASYQF